MLVYKRTIFILILTIFLLNLIGTVTTYNILRNNERNRVNIARTQQTKLLAATATALDEKIKTVIATANRTSQLFINSGYSYPVISKLIKENNLWLSDGIVGVGIVEATHQKNQSFGIYWVNRGKFIESSIYDSNYKDLLPENIWYNNIIQNHSQQWTKPYYDPSLKQFIISYSIPIYDKSHKKYSHILVVDLDMQLFDSIVSQNIGEKYTSIVDAHGDYIYDSNIDKIITGVNLGHKDSNNNLIDQLIYNKFHNNKCITTCQTVFHLDKVPHLAVYQDLKNVPWMIFADFNYSQLQALNRTSDNQLTMINIGFTTGAVTFLIMLLHLIFLKRKNSIKILWQCSLMITLALVIGIVHAWQTSTQLYYLSTDKAITNAETLQKYLTPYNELARLKKTESITLIPTSIMVDSIEFLNSYNIQITGHIMQRYPKSLEAERGIKFNDGFDIKINQINEEKFNTYDVITWSFQIKVRENFDYTHYPFNQGNVWLAMSPISQQRNLLLVPDFVYYNSLTDINSANGIAKNLIIPGWHIRGSYFTYENDSSRMLNAVNTYQTIDLPTLAFNVIVGAAFGDALITTIIPPLIIVLILFVTLMTISRRKNKFIEFKVASILSSSSGMLFTIVFTHVSLRNKLTSAIMYIEYFYLLMYIVVLLIPINAFLFATNRYKTINFGNNIIVKLLFFPIITLLVFIISLWRFS